MENSAEARAKSQNGRLGQQFAKMFISKLLKSGFVKLFCFLQLKSCFRIILSTISTYTNTFSIYKINPKPMHS